MLVGGSCCNLAVLMIVSIPVALGLFLLLALSEIKHTTHITIVYVNTIINCIAVAERS